MLQRTTHLNTAVKKTKGEHNVPPPPSTLLPGAVRVKLSSKFENYIYVSVLIHKNLCFSSKYFSQLFRSYFCLRIRTSVASVISFRVEIFMSSRFYAKAYVFKYFRYKIRENFFLKHLLKFPK